MNLKTRLKAGSTFFPISILMIGIWILLSLRLLGFLRSFLVTRKFWLKKILGENTIFSCVISYNKLEILSSFIDWLESFFQRYPTKIFHICQDTTFGCCADGKTAAGDSYGEGCPTEITCRDMAFGCCPDGVSIANGANGEGCENAPTSIPSKSHQFTTNAISTDSVSTVMEEDMSITDDVIVTEIAEKLFDVYTTAPSVTELPDVVVSESDTAAEKEMPDCSSSTFGCCPDDVTFKLGNWQLKTFSVNSVFISTALD